MKALSRLRVLAALIAAVCIPSAPAPAAADPVSVSYTASGRPGDWLLTFSVTNSFPAPNFDMGVYLFGVLLPQPNVIAGSPGAFEPQHVEVPITSRLPHNNLWSA